MPKPDKNTFLSAPPPPFPIDRWPSWENFLESAITNPETRPRYLIASSLMHVLGRIGEAAYGLWIIRNHCWSEARIFNGK